MRYLLLSLLLIFPAFAQDKKQKVPDMPALEVVKDSEARMTKKIILLVDASSSMTSVFPKAVATATAIASQSVDEYEVLPMLFGTEVIKYPHGWIKMPSEIGSLNIMGWLTISKGQVGGTTNATKALKAAYKEAKDKKATIVFITDGDVGTDVKLPAAPEDALVMTLQTEHVDYTSYVAWAKKINGLWVRFHCDHEYLEPMDESPDPWQQVWTNRCHKCGKSKPADK
jgi:hypothetical protein